jgi:hypothetical protein
MKMKPLGNSVFIMKKMVMALSIVMFLTACASQEDTLRIGGNVAVAGQTVADSGLEAYTEFIKQKQNEKLLELQDEIILVPSDKLREIRTSDASQVAGPGIEKFNALKRAYREYQKLTGGTFGQEASTAAGGLVSTVNEFGGSISAAQSGKNAIPDQAAQTIQSLLLVAVTEAQARDVRRLNKGFESLAQAYQVWWKEEERLLGRSIADIYDSHITLIRQYPPTRFDQSLIQRNATTPFDARTNTKFYQIDAIRAAMDQQDQSLDKLATVSRGLDRLITAHAELSKEKPSLSATLDVLEKIDIGK